MGKRLIAWSLWLAAVGNCVASLVVALVLTRPLTFAMLFERVGEALAFSLGLATIGLILATRRPANPIGWLYAASGVVWSLASPWSPWVDRLVQNGRPLPLAAQVAAVARDFIWAPAVALAITLPFLLVPDGRLRSPRWRVVAAASLVAATIGPVAGGLVPGRLVQTPITNPFGLRGMAGVAAVAVAATCLALYWGSVLAALVCVALRFRDSRGIERQQLRWVAAAATAAVAGLLLISVGLLGTLPVAALVGGLAVWCMPLCVAVAILRYRLYDLDYLISRTVVYGLLTAAGVGV